MTDLKYEDASLAALGRNFATVFREMVAGGMERGEALEVLKVWVSTAVLRPPDTKSNE